MRKIGKTKIKLAQMLRDLGLVIEAEDLHSIQGYYRFHARELDVCSWDGWAVAGVAGFTFKNRLIMPGTRIALSSYDTMSDLVKHGFDFWQHHDDKTDFELMRKE